MPKSKKPRHKRAFPSFRSTLMVFDEEIELLKQEFSKLELAVEMKLPMGNCDATDIYLFKDFIQWGIIAMTVRTWLPKEERDTAADLLTDTAKAVFTVLRRGIDHNHHFVCTGDELNTIRDGMQFAGELMNDSLNCGLPKQALKEWAVMRKFSDKASEAEGKHISVSEKTLINEVKNVILRTRF